MRRHPHVVSIRHEWGWYDGTWSLGIHVLTDLQMDPYAEDFDQHQLDSVLDFVTTGIAAHKWEHEPHITINGKNDYAQRT